MSACGAREAHASVQMRQMRDLIGAQGAAAVGVIGPAEYPRLEEGAVDDQLTAALKQIEQAYLAFGTVELVVLLNCHPRHAPAFGGQRRALRNNESAALPRLFRNHPGRRTVYQCSTLLSA